MRLMGILFLVAGFMISCGQPIKRGVKKISLSEEEIQLSSNELDVSSEAGDAVCVYKGTSYFAGESFKDDCNACGCMRDGTVVCTQMGCEKKPKKKNRKKCRLGKKIFKIGESFRRKCNTCSCTKDGIVCSRMGCVDTPPEFIEPIKPIKKVCVFNKKKYKLGQSVKKECNTCSCTEAGMVCSKMGCVDDRPIPPAQHSCEYNGNQYRLGKSFKSEDGCNMCSCTKMGVVCTKRACEGPIFN